MEKTSNEKLTAIKSHLKRMNRMEGKTAEQMRRDMAAAAASMPKAEHIAARPVTIAHLHGEWVNVAGRMPENGKQTILYFHGGGFIAGSCEFYRDMAGKLAEACGVTVLTVDYRLAPEHPYPAANEDCLAAYRWLLAQGYPPRGIVIGGDSVGATLALMTLLTLRDAGEPLPAGAFLMSPHTDLVHLDGESYRTRAELDPTGSLEGNRAILDAYWGGRPGPKPALLSPLRADLRGLPQLLIQAGDHEVLLSDATRFADRAKAAGVDVTLEVWDNMWSVFQMLAHMLPEARQAIANIGRFVGETLGQTDSR